jgi:hypothetical protein
MVSLPVSSVLLATILEIECTEGRDPNIFVENLVSHISAPPGNPSSSKSSRALSAFIVSLKHSTNSPLKVALDAVDSLIDFCDEHKRGQIGAVISLGIDKAFSFFSFFFIGCCIMCCSQPYELKQTQQLQ